MTARAGSVDCMDTTSWLIIATGAGPVIGAVAGALAAPSFTNALRSLASARASRVEHVEASGSDLYANGVPLTETQFRDAFAAMQAELDSLSPPAERNDWELQRQYAAINRLSVLAGTYPQALPIRSNADDAWQWYAQYNRYATRELREDPWTLEGLPGNPVYDRARLRA
jgi:hypothetical protein